MEESRFFCAIKKPGAAQVHSPGSIRFGDDNSVIASCSIGQLRRAQSTDNAVVVADIER